MPRRRLMKRLRRLSFDLLDFGIGPAAVHFPGVPEEALMRQIRADWAYQREVVLEEWALTHPGTRPWAWWAFDAGEDMPSEQLPRLLELEALEPHELRALASVPDHINEGITR